MSATISVITATYNAVNTLPSLVESLIAQTDKNFNWIVVDGGSTDGTVEYLNTINELEICVSSQADFGIYDALNRGIKFSGSEYYIVIGADDCFYSEAIENYKKIIENNQDVELLAVGVKINGVNEVPQPSTNSWLRGQMAYIKSHSVGLAIKKKMHERIGYYSNQFPIAADQLFILRAIKDGAKLVQSDFIAGQFSTEGVSSSDYVGAVTEFFRVQVLVGENKYLQIILLVLRLLKNLRRF